MNKIDTENEIKEAISFVQSTELGTEMSPLWKEMYKDFSFSRPSNLRDYSINREYDFESVTKFYNLSTKIKILSKIWVRVSNILLSSIYRFERFITSIISKIIFRDFKASQKYSFDVYPLEAYEEHQNQVDIRTSYENYNSENNIFFSHNNYKSFTYFHTLKKYIDLKDLESKNILEIGSGLFNFGTILSKNLDQFSYYCIDLPDVALRGYLSAKENIDEDVELFLPHQLEDFNMSSSQKKIIFLIPSQLDHLDFNIALFINHESFSEMNIQTVNDYLAKVREKMGKDSYIFLVNRFSRLQSLNAQSNDYTNFLEYELDDYDEICFEVEKLRSFLPVQKDHPNVVFIGKRKIN